MRIAKEDAEIIRRDCGPGVVEELTDWAREEGLTALYVRRPLWSVPGRSYTGASLLAVECAPPARMLIVKVLPAGASAREPEALSAALDAAPDFARRHLVGQPFPARDLPDGRTLMFQEAAGDSLRDSAPLGSLDGEETDRVLAEVVRGLLTEWNGPAEERAQGAVPEPVTASEFLRAELGDAWEGGGSVRAWGRGLGVLEPSPPWVYSDGLRLPNPYLMVAGGSAALPDPSVRVLRGRAHGDLHLDNVIVSRWEKEVRADEYRLIDLCTFRDRAALGRDLATLLLSALVPHIRHPLPPDQRHALLRFVVDPAATHRAEIVPKAAARVAAVRDTALRIMRERHWSESWELQFLLSLQAQALLFTSYTDLGDTGRTWCARLAAHAAGELLGRTGSGGTAKLSSERPARDSFEMPGLTGPHAPAAPAFVPDQAPRRKLWSAESGVRDKEAVVGFGPDHTVVVVDGRGGVRRWTVSGEELPGVGGRSPALRLGHQALVASLTHSVVAARPEELDITHFPRDGGVRRAAPVRLGTDHFLVTSGGDVLATHDRNRLTVRRFDDGTPIESVVCPPSLAASAVSTDGSVIAMASSRRVHIHRRGAEPLVKETVNSLPYARHRFLRALLPDPGCWLAVSPSGGHVGCVTFEEVVVWSVDDDKEVYRRPLGDRESLEGGGAAQMRLVCTDTGTLLWLKRGRLVCPTVGPAGTQLQQSGYYNDFAATRDGRRIATLDTTGRLDVWET
ncbi:hypothetical protein OG981_39440 [Streptomyces mirabilis]|uniref:hypothetical protein n=1 Tax=Streptomyces mirabilis TaxID=68239 RepID=UPI002E2505ED